ncbi:hypothetical protein M2390_002003 [Mycetocola sp. BIGb0189]|uniref:hypothetical protein n=1 Tax=Mycetocola sp. BIGb0189 TaxID=2940604 RepID=UPI0021680858|nr:hypothetical protein [Mycetocola sp. BIGb0189]MCS4276809.1 hypothetical protein [Mycetocola sp. BIGb0189]
MEIKRGQITALVLGAIIAIALVVLVVLGFGLANLPGSALACEGDVVSTDLCEPAKLGRTIFGGLIAAGALIALAIVAVGAGSVLLRRNAR